MEPKTFDLKGRFGVLPTSIRTCQHFPFLGRDIQGSCGLLQFHYMSIRAA